MINLLLLIEIIYTCIVQLKLTLYTLLPARYSCKAYSYMTCYILHLSNAI